MMLMKEVISVNAARGTTLVFLLLLAGTPVNGQGLMGGRGESVAAPCISEFERAEIAQALADYEERIGPLSSWSPGGTPEKFTFYPMGGTLYRDLFTNNFVDLDPSLDIQDWDCTGYTYNGHDGSDVDIRSFGEQLIGVPIFSALDGTVISTHDGEDDMCTSCCGTANYVIIDHGNGRVCNYWHLKKNSVQVSFGQIVRAGEQLGLAASSGCSTYPHLHFATYDNSVLVEPYAGPCRAGESEWTNQTPIYRGMYLRDLNITDVDIASYPGLPFDMPRTGTFLTGVQAVRFWVMLANHPAGSTWRVRYRRPDQTIAFDSGPHAFGNPFYRWSWWWWWYNVNLNQSGTWHLLFEINGEVLVEAPFDVVAFRGDFVNRPPHPISVQLEPAVPTVDHVLICRVETDLVLDDPDYDIVQYQYTWTVGGQVERVFVGAAYSDVLPHHTAGPGELVECTVVPGDGSDSGPSASASIRLCDGTCGDGTLDPVCETCDDGNTDEADGCSSICAVEDGCVCSGEPSMCLCRPVSPPPPHDILKNRYISIDPRGAGGANEGKSFDIRLTLTSTLVTGVTAVGSAWWANEPDKKCISIVGPGRPSVPPNWDACPTLHLTGCPVIPTSTYDIVVMDGSLASDPPLSANTQAKPGAKWHGDCVGFFTGTEWTAPNANTNIDDAVAAIKTFQNPSATPGCSAPPCNATHTSVTDMEPNLTPGSQINSVVNIADVFSIILGFQGQEYPGPDLTQCP